MNLRIPRERLLFLLRLALPVAAVIILFFSGILPLEDLLSVPFQSLTASVAASDVASLTNQDRLENGLPPLAVSPLLNEAAQLKADDMAKYSYYAHTGPDGKTMLDWMNIVGYHYLNAGENLVIDRSTAQEAVDAWMNSPDHRANILRPQFTQIGVGVAEGEYRGIHTIFVVQEFGTPYPTSATLAAAPKPAKSAPVAPPAPLPIKAPSVPVPSPKPVTAAPLTLPHIASLQTATPLAPTGAGSTASTSERKQSSGPPEQGTSTISFTLAPEFYVPVTLTPRQNAEANLHNEAPQGRSISRLSLWTGKIRAFLRHLF